MNESHQSCASCARGEAQLVRMTMKSSPPGLSCWPSWERTMDTVGTGRASQFRLSERQFGWRLPCPRRRRRPSIQVRGRGTSCVPKTRSYRRPDATGTAHDALLGTDRSQGHRTSTLGCLDECQPGSGWHVRCDCVAVAASHGCSADEATHHQKQVPRLPSKRARHFYPRR